MMWHLMTRLHRLSGCPAISVMLRGVAVIYELMNRVTQAASGAEARHITRFARFQRIGRPPPSQCSAVAFNSPATSGNRHQYDNRSKLKPLPSPSQLSQKRCKRNRHLNRGQFPGPTQAATNHLTERRLLRCRLAGRDRLHSGKRIDRTTASPHAPSTAASQKGKSNLARSPRQPTPARDRAHNRGPHITGLRPTPSQIAVARFDGQQTVPHHTNATGKGRGIQGYRPTPGPENAANKHINGAVHMPNRLRRTKPYI